MIRACSAASARVPNKCGTQTGASRSAWLSPELTAEIGCLAFLAFLTFLLQRLGVGLSRIEKIDIRVGDGVVPSIKGVRGALLGILLTMIENACKFAARGATARALERIELDISLQTGTRRLIRFAIADWGVGVEGDEKGSKSANCLKFV